MIRLIDIDQDYNTIVSWWKHYNYPIIPRESLSTTGFMINDMFAVWVYLTNSNICYIENAIKDPSKELSDEVMSRLFDFIKEFCLSQGHTNIMTFSLNIKFIERLKSLGFVCSEKQLFVLNSEVR